jgi:ABC-type dipeptide/oligopeptide/nickel transport system permease component
VRSEPKESAVKIYEYVARRLLLMVPVLLGVALITFVISHLVPGDPARLVAGPHAPIEVILAVRTKMGLDKPVYEQFLIYVSDLARGDFGMSITTRRPVLDDLLMFFPATIELTVAAMLLSVAIGVPLGIASATRQNTLPDHLSRIFALAGIATPVFWSGLMVLLLFYYRLGVLPGPGRIDIHVITPRQITGLYVVDSVITGNWSALASSLKHLVLPASVLAFSTLGAIVRMVRSSMLEVLREDYIVLARAKGLPERIVVYKHALKNALTSTVTLSALIFGTLLTGTVLVEAVFAWPGIGRYAVTAIEYLDFAAVMGYTLLVTLIYLTVNLSVDVLYALIDPRVRLE